MYVCICHALTTTDIEDHITAGARTPLQVGKRCGAGTDCGSCVKKICAILRAADDEAGNIDLKIAG
ncbi:[Fe-S]-binding protein [Rhodococcus sp. D2-41]|nr:[Fe-S]-binding protein [Rhodococcus sp. D2-41]